VQLQFPNEVIALLAALVPFLTAAATKPERSNALRTIFAVAASVALAVVGQIIDSTPDTVTELAGFALTNFLTALGGLGLGKGLFGDINAKILPKAGV
jgi:hypothetical protein